MLAALWGRTSGAAAMVSAGGPRCGRRARPRGAGRRAGGTRTGPEVGPGLRARTQSSLVGHLPGALVRDKGAPGISRFPLA